MDAVTVIEPLIDEAAPVVADAMKVLYATGDIIVLDAKDLQKIAIRAGAVVVYVGFMRWQWKKNWQPWLEEHKEKKRVEKIRKQNVEEFKAEARKAENKIRSVDKKD